MSRYTKSRKCKYCGSRIKGDDIGRGDIAYCKDSSTCRSKYHQEIGRGYRGNHTAHLIHKEKDHIHHYNCLVCGIGFDVNDYAERTGKRTPMYCSAKCKQKAYRQREKERKNNPSYMK